MLARDLASGHKEMHEGDEQPVQATGTVVLSSYPSLLVLGFAINTVIPNQQSCTE